MALQELGRQQMGGTKMKRLWLLLSAALLLVGCSDPEADALRAKWDGAVIVKICVDGTRIYRLHDGRYFSGGIGSNEVENPGTVCASK
jgi:hypothetical protein